MNKREAVMTHFKQVVSFFFKKQLETIFPSTSIYSFKIPQQTLLNREISPLVNCIIGKASIQGVD